MKPNKQITSGVALLFIVQNLLFPQGVQAQSSTGQVMGSIATGVATQLPAMFGQAPSKPDFNTTSSSIQQSMNRCLTAGALGLQADATTAGNSAVNNVQKWENILNTKKSGSTSTVSGGVCQSCKKPDASLFPEEPNCSKFVTHKRVEESDGKQGKRNYQELADKVNKEMAPYLSCLESNRGCKDPKQAELEKQLNIFNCQMKVLEQGVQESAQILNKSIQANQKMFGDMNQHQKEVGEQMQQVDEILGPDPELGKSGSSQMQGLLGMQKELNESLPKMVEAEAKFKTEIENIKNETKTNEQNLEATRVNVASSCIKGSRNVGVSGGYSLTCFKPVQTTSKDGTAVNVTDRNGNIKYAKQSCGPYDYIRSKIEQRAFVTSRGVMMNESRREKAAANSVAFDSLVDSINRAMGDYDQKGADNARLDTDVHSWSDIESKVSANIDAVSSSSGVDVRTMLRAVAGHCFQEADQWKNKQIRSSGSEYSKKKAELKRNQSNLTAQMDTGLTSMNKTYGDIMSVMFNKHVTLNRTQCTKDNPDLMHDCFARVRQNVQDLLEGNGNLTTTAKTIKGGPSTPPFVVSCRGLNGCVTAFKNVRDTQKTYMRSVQKAKESYVNQSNQATQGQLTFLSNQLSEMQKSLMSQYDLIKANLVSMGVDVPERPKTMEGEALEAMEGPDKTPGPFKNPKNMSSVLSGMMQPGGMINFGDTGMREPLKDLAAKQKEKSAKNEEEIKAIKTMQAKYANIEETCNIDPSLSAKSEDESGRVGVSSQSCNQAISKLNACSTAMSSNTVEDTKRIDELNKLIEKLKEENDKLAKKYKPTATWSVPDQNNYEANRSKITTAEAEIEEIRKIGTSSGSTAGKESFESIIYALNMYMETSKNLDNSNKVSELGDEFEQFYDPNAAACKAAKDKLESCSSQLKNVYTEEQKRSNSGDAGVAN